MYTLRPRPGKCDRVRGPIGAWWRLCAEYTISSEPDRYRLSSPGVSHEAAEGGERPAHARLAARLARRAITFPLLLVVWAAALLALGGLPLALLGDLARRRRLAACRALLALAALASAEVLGVLAALGLGLGAPFVSRARFRGWNARLQRAWVEGLWAGVRRLYGLRLRVEGGPVAPDAPLLVLVRHTSLIDTLLPLLVLEPRFELRWVLKQELLWDPCLDLVGLRLPNVFVSRDGGQGEREAARVAALARAIGPGRRW